MSRPSARIELPRGSFGAAVLAMFGMSRLTRGRRGTSASNKSGASGSLVQIAFRRDHLYDNGYAHPIEGIIALIDLNRHGVIRMSTTTASCRSHPCPATSIPEPVGPRSGTTSSRSRSRSRKGRASRSMATSRLAELDFVVGFNAREGLTLHHLGYHDEADRPSSPRVAHRDGRPLRRPGPDARPQERLRRGRIRHGMPPTASSSAATAWARSATSTPTSATQRASR